MKEHAVLKRPSTALPSVSSRSFVSPPFCNGRTPSILAIFGSAYDIPVMVLPLFMSIAMSLSSSLDNVQKISAVFFFFSIFVFVFLRKYQILTASGVTCPSFGRLHAKKHCVADCFANSMFAHLF